MPRLTSIICNFNHAPHLPESVGAMLAQVRPEDQLILVDDGSTDDSVRVIEGLTDGRAEVLFLRNESNRGLLWSMERAVAAADGDYLYLGSADDYVLPGFFAKAMQAAEAHPGTGLIFGGFVAENETTHFKVRCRIPGWGDGHLDGNAFRKEAFEHWTRTTSFTPTAVYRTDAFRQVGGYRADLTFMADNFAAWSVGCRYGAYYLDHLCTNFRCSSNSYGNRLQRDLVALRQAIELTASAMRREEFSDCFPPAFVEHWETETLKAACVPYTLDHVRQAFVSSANWRSPFYMTLAGVVATLMPRFGKQLKTSPLDTYIVNNPHELVTALIALSSWRRPTSKLVALVMSCVLSLQRLKSSSRGT